MNSGYWIDNGYIYGPIDSGQFWISGHFIYGPRHSGKYWIKDNFFGGPRKTENFGPMANSSSDPTRIYRGWKKNS